MSYEDITVNDPNPVKRWIQRRRFDDALKALEGLRPAAPLRILDFGCADGELVRRMAGTPAVIATVYEPESAAMDEARRKLAGLDWVTFADSLDLLAPASFDYVFCLEVFEHLPDRETDDALAAIHRLLKPDGNAVIGVPLELFLPALLKGIFRMSRRHGSFDAMPGNTLAAVMGRPPSQRPAREVCPGLHYYDSHLGFDYRALERKMAAAQFHLLRKWYCPFPILGSALNSEVYYLARKAG